MKNKITTLIVLLLTGCLWGCNKFLDEKTDKKLVVPTRLADLQALLDHNSFMNAADPGEGEAAADDYYLPEATWKTLSNEVDRRLYTWEPDFTTTHTSWNVAYRHIYYANIILEHLEGIDDAEAKPTSMWDNIAGQAYFLRARGHLMAQLIWAAAYEENTAEADLGVPLRLSADFNRVSSRPTNKEVYSQIISDLEKAVALLPDKAMYVLRASKPAAQALLARTYLFMREYDKCLQYASSSLQIQNALMDYNELDTSLSFPMPQFNIEVLHHSSLIATYQPIQQSRALVDTVLYALYDEGDLRKYLFFRDNGNKTHSFKGSYFGTQSHFSGVAVDEVYLMRAECYARMGMLVEAVADLNYLLHHRYRKGSFIPFEAGAQQQVLNLILTERRKELLFRGLRFPDVKRLNREGADISFERYFKESNTLHSLLPNDPRFALSIAETVLERAPHLIQNPR